MILSPTRRLPFCTNTVHTGPRPLSSLASITTPWLGLAFNSITSATSKIFSSKSSIPWRCLADTGTIITSPPHSSGNKPCSANCCLTWSGLAPGLSILLMATIIGTLADFAWLIASIVCGITPSSAATTNTAISVDCAPRKRIAVNASWPGVSKNVILLPL